MNKRILFPLALVVLAALALSACGGGGSSDEDKIAETIETSATTSDPGNCTQLETLTFAEQNSQRKGKAAIETCEQEAEAGEHQAEGANVSNVSISGSTATADVRFKGGSLGSQSLEVALVEEDGDWKLDRIAGFAEYDGRALGEVFEKHFEEDSGKLTPAEASCISGKIAEASRAEAEELFLSGSPDKIIELAQACA